MAQRVRHARIIVMGRNPQVILRDRLSKSSGSRVECAKRKAYVGFLRRYLFHDVEVASGARVVVGCEAQLGPRNEGGYVVGFEFQSLIEVGRREQRLGIVQSRLATLVKISRLVGIQLA